MNKKTFKLNKLYVVMTLVSAQNAFAAANFNITPYGTLPTTVASGQSVSANFTVTNMTNTTRNGYFITGLPSTVTQNTTSPNCTNPINLGPNASCQLQLDITGAVSSNFAICKGNSCTTATTPLNVSVSSAPKTPRFAYVTQYDSTHAVVVCTVEPTSGLLSDCVDVGAHGVLDNTFPQGITINSAGTIAYLTGYTDTPFAYQCTINQNDGTFSECSSSNITTPTGYNPEYGMLTLNSASTTTYIADSSGSGRILACPIVSGVISPICSDTGATGIGNDPAGIVFNTSGTIAYIGDYSTSNTVTECAFNGSTFSSCNNKTGDDTLSFTDPAGVVLNSSGSILYVTNSSAANVYGCETTPNGPTEFSHCFIATAGISDAWGITLNAQGTVAYVTDYINTVSICPILPDGTFPTCTPNTSFTSPVGIALLY